MWGTARRSILLVHRLWMGGKGKSREGPRMLGWGQITIELSTLRSRDCIP